MYRSNQVFNLHEDRISTQSQRSLISQFEWRHCGCQYVGKTVQRFADRISEHVPKHIPRPTAETARPLKKRENPAAGYKSAVACCKNDKARDPQAMLTLSTYIFCLQTKLMMDVRKLPFFKFCCLLSLLFFCHMLSSLSFCFYVYSPSCSSSSCSSRSIFLCFSSSSSFFLCLSSSPCCDNVTKCSYHSRIEKAGRSCFFSASVMQVLCSAL